MRAVGGRWALPTDRLGSGCCEVIEVAELGLCARLILAGVFEIRRRPFYVLNQIWPRHGELAWVESIRVAGWLVSPIREPILCDPERDRAPGPMILWDMARSCFCALRSASLVPIDGITAGWIAPRNQDIFQPTARL